MKDLIVLAADLDIERVVQELIPRLPHVYGTRPVSFDIFRHQYRDSGCATGSPEFLRPFLGQYQCALVVFDREGSGQEARPREAIEAGIEAELVQNGWPSGRVMAIAIDPEIENWMWVPSPRVAAALNWIAETSLYDWLMASGYLTAGSSKPHRPKEAMEAVLRHTRRPRSASIYEEIARHVSFRSCTDASFLKMMQGLRHWFAGSGHDPEAAGRV
ncbi:MAG: hypothetical protein NW241_13915 [Bacteroidia bacterium]|nr:hypothetical protein [Bacteroidia bacterium]